ncbi:LysR family transcriptional regulator [Bradyrhizobium sp. CB3481]|uniref:LysR family transcriptional regulator n=1 Tax=Bradyrhizobium sp. CB3481 TaxID=3039158 RepID=UPI0024B1D2B6|nr:LysR family transcriptional regulator [Bradyrhizobium sp. CB3481]WFU15709.1 LysR family transcriptional regulator [Bradyrhizobium sp. CB3481]
MNKASFSEAEAYLAVVDRGGFGAAARELGVTQSTISRRIAALEQRIGKRLVERTTRRVTPTEAGLAFANDLRDVLARLADAEGRVQAEGSEAEGLLRVTMPTAYGRTAVLPHLAVLAKRHPRLRFELDLSDRYADILEEGYDLAIRIAEPTQSGLVSERIDRFTLHVCASPDYMAKHPPIERPQNLAAHACIVQRTYAPRSKWRFEWSGDLIEIEIAPRIIASDMMAVRSLVLDATGVAILPSFLARDDLASGRLVEVLGEAGLPAINVYASFPHHRAGLSKIRVAVEELRRGLIK